MPDPYLELSDRIERVIDEAQEHHLNGNLSTSRTRLREATELVDRLLVLEARGAMAAQKTGEAR